MTLRTVIVGSGLLVSMLVLLSGTALSPAGAPAGGTAAPAAGAGKPAGHAREMVRAAEEVLRLLQEQEDVGGRALSADFVTEKLEWSRRAFLAVRETQPGAKEEQAAARAHRDRAKKTLDTLERAEPDGSHVPIEAARYFLAEAELWLARANEK